MKIGTENGAISVTVSDSVVQKSQYRYAGGVLEDFKMWAENLCKGCKCSLMARVQKNRMRMGMQRVKTVLSMFLVENEDSVGNWTRGVHVTFC